MISIIRTTRDIGVVLYNEETGKFMHAEICDVQRMVKLVTNFPTQRVEIVIDKESPELVEQILSYVPHVELLAKVVKVKELDVRSYVQECTKPRTNKKGHNLIYIALGVIVGCAILLPTSQEYRSSVLTQAQNMQSYASEQEVSSANRITLTSAIDAMYGKYDVDAVVYQEGTYSVIFTSSDNNLTVQNFSEFPSATLSIEMRLKNSEGQEITIYRLEGVL